MDFMKKGDKIISDHKPLAVNIKVRRDDSMTYPVIDSKLARRQICKWNNEENKWELKKEFNSLTVRELIAKKKQMEPGINEAQIPGMVTRQYYMNAEKMRIGRT